MKAQLQRHWPLSALTGTLLLGVLLAMLAPLGGGSHQVLLEIPPGAHRTGLAVPHDIRLTRGVRDVLVVRNLDSVPVVFGPLRVKAGGELRLPFEEVGVHHYVCPPVIGRQVTLQVLAAPGPGWRRLRWRLDNLAQSVRTLPLRPPGD